MEISPIGHVHGIDRSALLQAVDDAQQQMRATDVDDRYRIAAELQRQREGEHSAEAALATGGAVPVAGDLLVEAAQRPADLPPPVTLSSPHTPTGLSGGSSPSAFALDDSSLPSSPSFSPTFPPPFPTSSPKTVDDADNADDDLADFEETEELIDDLFHQAETLLANADASKADIAEAMQLMHQAAALGCSEAQHELGMAYLYGDLLPRNLSLAHQHFLDAADDGNSDAQHSLAFLYALHLAPPPPTWPASTPFSTPLSVLYDYLSAAAGNVGAKLTMGYRHLHGYGVPRSCETAASFYRDVAQQVVDEVSAHAHHQLTFIDRAHLSDESSRSSPVEDSAEVLQYYRHSAEGGNVEAQLTLGQLHYYGHRGLPHSPALAAQYFSQAAAAGDSNAMTSLGQMHLNGLVPSSDDTRNATALSLFQQAAAQGNAHAQTSLGLLYLTGEAAVPINYTTAYSYFFQAQSKGHPEAQFRLGVMHFAGLGVEPSMVQAFLFFSAAAMQGHVRALFNVAQMETHGMGVLRNCRSGVDKLKAVAERGDWSEDLGEAHELFLEGEYERSWLLYALSAHEGQEVGQSNAAWLIDREYVQLWEGQQRRWDVAYELLRQSAEQKNFDSWRRMGDYAYYQLISNHTTLHNHSPSSTLPSTPHHPQPLLPVLRLLLLVQLHLFPLLLLLPLHLPPPNPGRLSLLQGQRQERAGFLQPRLHVPPWPGRAA